MTTVTSCTRIAITTHSFMIFIGICFIMFVAINAAKNFEVTNIGMTIETCIPFSPVISTIYWKILAVVIKC